MSTRRKRQSITPTGAQIVDAAEYTKQNPAGGVSTNRVIPVKICGVGDNGIYDAGELVTYFKKKAVASPLTHRDIGDYTNNRLVVVQNGPGEIAGILAARREQTLKAFGINPSPVFWDDTQPAAAPAVAPSMDPRMRALALLAAGVRMRAEQQMNQSLDDVQLAKKIDYRLDSNAQVYRAEQAAYLKSGPQPNFQPNPTAGASDRLNNIARLNEHSLKRAHQQQIEKSVEAHVAIRKALQQQEEREIAPIEATTDVGFGGSNEPPNRQINAYTPAAGQIPSNESDLQLRVNPQFDASNNNSSSSRSLEVVHLPQELQPFVTHHPVPGLRDMWTFAHIDSKYVYFLKGFDHKGKRCLFHATDVFMERKLVVYTNDRNQAVAVRFRKNNPSEDVLAQPSGAQPPRRIRIPQQPVESGGGGVHSGQQQHMQQHLMMAPMAGMPPPMFLGGMQQQQFNPGAPQFYGGMPPPMQPPAQQPGSWFPPALLSMRPPAYV